MTTATTRVCFQLQVSPELLDEYIARHTPVWPEMLAEIAAAGRRNYSLFLGDGGRLIGYYETDDDDGRAGLPRELRGRRPLGGRDGPLLRRPRRPARPGGHSPHRDLQPRTTSSPPPGRGGTSPDDPHEEGTAS